MDIRGWYRGLSSQQRDMVSLVGEGTLLVILLGVSTFAWNQRHSTVKTNTVVETRTVQASASPAPSPVQVGPSETATIPVDSVAPGYKLTLSVPTAWRTVDIKSLISLDTYPGYNLNDLAAILRFVPEHPERNTAYPVNEPVNRLDILATSHWVAVNEDAPATSANKQAYLAYLSSLKTGADIAGNKCRPISIEDSVCTDLKVRPQVVKSADGALSGMAYLYMQTQSVSYDPTVVVEMVGSVGGKPVRVAGSFVLYDQLAASLGANGAQSNANSSDYVARVTAARQAFASGNPSAETLDMYGRIAAVVGSMRFTR